MTWATKPPCCGTCTRNSGWEITGHISSETFWLATTKSWDAGKELTNESAATGESTTSARCRPSSIRQSPRGSNRRQEPAPNRDAGRFLGARRRQPIYSTIHHLISDLRGVIYSVKYHAHRALAQLSQ